MADKYGTLLDENNNNFYPNTKATSIEGFGTFVASAIDLDLGTSNYILTVNSNGDGLNWVQPWEGATISNQVIEGSNQAVSSGGVYNAIENAKEEMASAKNISLGALSISSGINIITGVHTLENFVGKTFVSEGYDLVLICTKGEYQTGAYTGWSCRFLSINPNGTTINVSAATSWKYI